jgi:hypothetical protein
LVYGNPSAPGSREAAAFRNCAVAYYDARRADVWSTATPGIDTANLSRMQCAEGALVFKLLYGAARPADFRRDLLAGSLALNILPNAGGTPVTVRL